MRDKNYPWRVSRDDTEYLVKLARFVDQLLVSSNFQKVSQEHFANAFIRYKMVVNFRWKAIGKQLGLSPSYFDDVIKNRRQPRQEYIVRALRLLKSAVGELIREQNAGLGTEVEMGGHPAVWRAIPKQFSERILELARELDRLVLLARGSNYAGTESDALGPVQRQALISVLETAIAQLRSPMVEVGFLTKVGSSLKEIGLKVAKRKTEAALGAAATAAGATLVKIAERLLH